MKSTLALLFCIICCYANGQIYNNPFLNISVDSADDAKNDLQINSTYALASNAFNNGIFGPLLFGDSISDNAKNGVLKNLQPQNKLGLYLHNGIFYAWKASDMPRHYYIEAASRISFTSRFSPDTYKLLLFGNKQFAGKAADLSGFSFNENAYQSLQFGFYQSFKTSSSNSLVLGGGVSLVCGAGFARVNVPRGTFFTSENGDSLALDASYNAKLVNSNSLVTNVNGLGASINVFGAYEFKNKDVFRFQVADLGFVNWYHNTTMFGADQKVSFTGIKASADSGVFKVNDPQHLFDSISARFNDGKSSAPFTQLLPFQIRVMYVKHIDSTLFLTGAVEYINDNMTIPEVSLSAMKVFGRLSGRIGVSAFGYSTYGITLGLGYQIGDHINLLVGTQHLEGLALPESNGQGYFLSLRWRN